MAVRAEVSHQRVAAALRYRQGRIVTSDHVLQERGQSCVTVMVLGRLRSLSTPYVTGIATIEVSRLADLEVAATIGKAFAAQDFSLSDRTSWAIMERLGITDVVTLGNDFRHLSVRP